MKLALALALIAIPASAQTTSSAFSPHGNMQLRSATESLMRCDYSVDLKTLGHCTISEGHTLDEAVNIMLDQSESAKTALIAENEDLRRRLRIAYKLLATRKGHK